MMTNDQLLLEMKKYRLADLSDGMDALGLVNKGSMNPNMRPLRPGMEFKGFAYTVQLFPKQDGVRECNTVEEWREELGKGCGDIYGFMDGVTEETAKDMVIVIDMGGLPAGIWGSEIAMNTMIRGITGAIIDGGCRDSHETNLEKANVFCTQRTFNHAYGRVTRGPINQPITCAGVLVKPGDLVCADDDGVLVIPRERAEDVLKFAKMQLEDDIATRSSHYEKLGYKPDDTLARNK